MCVCMSVRMYAFLSICISNRCFVHLFIHKCLNMSVCISVCMSVRIHSYLCLYMCICTHDGARYIDGALTQYALMRDFVRAPDSMTCFVSSLVRLFVLNI